MNQYFLTPTVCCWLFRSFFSNCSVFTTSPLSSTWAAPSKTPWWTSPWRTPVMRPCTRWAKDLSFITLRTLKYLFSTIIITIIGRETSQIESYIRPCCVLLSVVGSGHGGARGHGGRRWFGKWWPGTPCRWASFHPSYLINSRDLYSCWLI